MSVFDFELISPEGLIHKNTISDLFVTTDDGALQILAQHADFRSKISCSPLKLVDQEKKVDFFAIIEAVLEVKSNKVTILAKFAKHSKDIDQVLAQKNSQELESKIQLLSPDAKKSNPELILAEANLQKEILLLKTAKLSKTI